jgi:aminoglycoside phosphotransferase (APT) family kinase protein
VESKGAPETSGRSGDVARALLDHLRRALGEPGLDFAEPPTALKGGFDTEIHAFRLTRAPGPFDGPLVLRVLRAHHDPRMILREQATQNAVADQGYPAPRVVHATLDPALLGAPFAVMERLTGVPLLSRVVGMAGVVVEAQLRLHALDPGSVRGTLPDLDGYLDRLGRRIEAAGLDGLAPLLGWLRQRRPRPEAAPVICHGDLHPQNILVRGRALSGVLDWPNAVVAEPAFDVASTFSILRWVPAGLVVPGPLGRLVQAAQVVLAHRYLAGYRRRRPIDPGRLAYYEVAAVMRALVQRGETERRGAPASPLDRSPYAARLLARATRITGLAASLP